MGNALTICKKYDTIQYNEYNTMESSKMKSESKSKKAREEGNNLHERKKYFEALLCYNKSLCYANSSLSKSLAFANRSATYFALKLYDKCIENIKLAREQGYPNDRRQTLDNREAKCIDLLAEPANRSEADAIRKINDRFKLSYPANPRIPFIVESLELRQDEQNGRGIYATMDLKPGDVIAAEDIYYEQRTKKTDYERCICCSKTNMLSLIPSEYAVSIMFCSEPCKNVFPLAFLKFLSNKDAASIQAAKIGATNTKYIEYEDELELKTVFDFAFVNVSTDVRGLINWKCFNGLRRSNITAKDADEIDDPIVEYLVSSVARFHDLNNIIKSRSLMRYHIELPSNNVVGAGRCVGLFGGLLNDSCDPNIQHITVDNKLVFFAIKPIRINEQLFISRWLPFYYSTKEGRHTVLDRECRCVACINNYPILADLPAASLSEVDVASAINGSQDTFEGKFNGMFAQIDRNWKLINEIHDQYPTKDACNAIMQNIEHLLKFAYLGSYAFEHPLDTERTLRERLENAESDDIFDE